MTNLNETLCKPPSVGFKVFNVNGSECLRQTLVN